MIVNVNKVTFQMGEIITSQTEIAKRMEKNIFGNNDSDLFKELKDQASRLSGEYNALLAVSKGMYT